jgi:hypothetical protein
MDTMALVRHQSLGIHSAAHATQCAAFSSGIVLPEPESMSLPKGYPSNMNASLAWDGANITESQYICHLSDDDIQEIETALESFKCKNIPV